LQHTGGSKDVPRKTQLHVNEPASQATNPINQTRYVWVEIRKPTVEEFAAHLRLKGSG